MIGLSIPNWDARDASPYEKEENYKNLSNHNSIMNNIVHNLSTILYGFRTARDTKTCKLNLQKLMRTGFIV